MSDDKTPCKDCDWLYSCYEPYKPCADGNYSCFNRKSEATRPDDSSGSTEFTGCEAKEAEAAHLYQDRYPVDVYKCGGCSEDFTVVGEPLYCPRCGVKVKVTDY